jgi:tetratricopeptide (TPR) repeat protein/transcriptional regulator with XRE-family HTH domain
MTTVEPGTAGGEPAFGSVLRELRLAAALTIEGLAEASGVSVRGIGDLERGHRTTPQRRTVTALARGLELSEADLRRLSRAARAGRGGGCTPVGVRAVARGVADFVGRERELSRFTELAASGTAPVVVTVSGAPGVGKTTLALEAARRLADRFTDGQIVVDMRGLEAEPPSPSELMLGVLRALRVADRELASAGPRGHLHLYRQTLARRRLVLVLDNARDEAQVRPLLPAAGAGVVVVTSRRMLTGLEGVHRLPLDPLGADESTALLTRLAGSERAADDPGELARVARFCGHLPLALSLAGHWLARHRTWTVTRLADRLAPAAGRLNHLLLGDVRVSAAFDLSYRQLGDAAGRMFRRLSLVPGPDISAAAAAQLTGQHLFDAEDALEELVEAGLLGVERDRYRMHDLLRLYARDKLNGEEDAESIERARDALHDWLLGTAIVAGRWFEPGYGAPPATWEADVDLSTADKGRQWLQDEDANWLAALHTAAASGRYATVVEVAESLHWFSDQWIYWGHWPEVFAVAADCAERLGDRVPQATQLNYLAWARLMCEGRPRDSLTYSARALALARLADDERQQAWAYFYQGWAHRKLAEYETAAERMRRSGLLFESVYDPEGSLTARMETAMILMESGRCEAANDAFRRSLDYLEKARDRLEEHFADIARAGIHGGLATCCEELGRGEEAVEHLRRAVDLSSESGNSGLESRHLNRLGHTLLGMSREAEAREVFSRIVALGPYADPRVAREAAARIESVDLPMAGAGRSQDR